MKTQVMELDERFGKEYAGCYIFAELSWAKRSHIIQKHTKYHPSSGQVVTSDYTAIQAETIWAALREQPPHKPVTLEKLLSEEDGVSVGLGELFSQIVNRLCALTQEEHAFLSEPSEGNERTKQSQNSAYAKNSDGHQRNSQGSHPKPSNNSSSS